MKVIEWAKAHPWTTGAVVVGGGLVFIFISGWFGGGGSANNVAVGSSSSGMSDAEIAAAAQIQAAQIQAQAYGTQAQTQLQSDQIIANLYATQAAYDYNLGIKQLEVGKDLTIAQINQQGASDYLNAYTAIALSQQQTQQNLALIQSQTKGKKNQQAVTSIVQAAQMNFPSYAALIGSGATTTSSSGSSGSTVQAISFAGGSSGPSSSAAQV